MTAVGGGLSLVTLDLDQLRAIDPTATDDEIATVLEAWADRAHALAVASPCWWWERLAPRDLLRRTAAALRSGRASRSRAMSCLGNTLG